MPLNWTVTNFFFFFVSKYKTAIKEHQQKTFVLISKISRLWPLWGGRGFWVSLFEWFFLGNAEWSSRKLWKMALADYPINCAVSPPHTEISQSICCTGFHIRAVLLAINGLKANVKQNEIKELVVRSAYFQNLKCNVKSPCIFHVLTFQTIQYTNTQNYMTQSLKPLNLLTINIKDESFYDSI